MKPGDSHGSDSTQSPQAAPKPAPRSAASGAADGRELQMEIGAERSLGLKDQTWNKPGESSQTERSGSRLRAAGWECGWHGTAPAARGLSRHKTC